MLNVMDFRDNAPRSRGSRSQRRPENVDAGISELASRITSLQSKASGEIHRAILMLDLAAEHARRIARRMHDPAVKKKSEEQISMIEQLLQLAREMARRL